LNRKPKETNEIDYFFFDSLPPPLILSFVRLVVLGKSSEDEGEGEGGRRNGPTPSSHFYDDDLSESSPPASPRNNESLGGQRYGGSDRGLGLAAG
jgi:hypothetical protein